MGWLLITGIQTTGHSSGSRAGGGVLRRVLASYAQENAILVALAELHVDPLAYPQPPRGKVCPVKRNLQVKLGYSKAVVEKALGRLRAESRIRYG